MDKGIDRADLPSGYEGMMKSESHHSHLIIEDKYGKLRWEECPITNVILKSINLNDLIFIFHSIGLTKNSEEYRKFYRDMGYSLDGYWEVFYWEVNNPDMDSYVQPVEEL